MAKTVTTQATGKKWKLIQLIGTGLIVWGIVGCMLIDDKSEEQVKSKETTTACLLVFGGVTVFLFGRIGAWWFHG